MADHDTPDDPFLERRLSSLALLPVAERPSLDDLDGRTVDHDRLPPLPGSDEDRRRRSHRVWFVTAAAAAVLVVASIAAVALTSGDPVVDLLDREVAETDQPLVGTRWMLERVIEDGASVAASDTGAYLDIVQDGSSTVMRGNDGCSSYGGTVTVTGDRFQTMEPLGEQVPCPNDGQRAAPYHEVLGPDSTFAIEGSVLTVTSGDGRRALVFRDDPTVHPPSTPSPGGTTPTSTDPSRTETDAAAALFGQRWVLVAYGSEDASTDVEPRAGETDRPWVRFSVDRDRFAMTMRGEDGCTTFGSDAAVMGDAIWFHTPFRLQVACPDADRELVARTMGDVLRGKATYEIDGARLVIHGERDSLELLAASEPEETAGTTTRPGRWVSAAVAADDRVITVDFGCAVDGAEAFDHVVVDTNWEKVRVTLVVRVPIEPTADACTGDVRGTFTVALDEPVAGREIVQR